MKTVVWARVSSREQKEGYSLDAQLRATRDRAAKNGWTILREFVVAESAKRGAERLAFNEMFSWVRANARREGIKAILAHKLDRVCRNMRDAVRLQGLEDECGVQLAFVENQFGPGAAGAFSFNIMAAVAQYYSDNLRNEVLKGMDEKVKQGWPTGRAPFGYLNVENKDEPVQPHPVEGKTVVRIFSLFASGQHTLDTMVDALAAEGHTYRPSQPKFTRTTLAYILKNRFYRGELVRNGKTYPGKFKLIVDPQTFDACQDLLAGRNRRTGSPEIMLSGGILRCAICGFAMTGEVIHKKLSGGGHKDYVYYRCSGSHKVADHPVVRWREADLEQAILADLGSMRITEPRIQKWFRQTLEAAFGDMATTEAERRRLLGKRRTELANMQDRLLNAFLAGTVDEAVFNAKSAELKAQQAEVERQLDGAGAMTEEAGKLALSVFDFSQNLAEIWRGSNSATRRQVLEAVSLNRTLSDTSLCLTKRKPFDFLAERPVLKIGRGDWTKFEPLRQALAAFSQPFLAPPAPYLLAAGRFALPQSA